MDDQLLIASTEKFCWF